MKRTSNYAYAIPTRVFYAVFVVGECQELLASIHPVLQDEISLRNVNVKH